MPQSRYHDLYNCARWVKLSHRQLRDEPLCRICAKFGRVTPATVCDHIDPHHGDETKFWRGPFQSLCKFCHDSIKRHAEIYGFYRGIGVDGWPIDPRHPVYHGARPLPTLE